MASVLRVATSLLFIALQVNAQSSTLASNATPSSTAPSNTATLLEQPCAVVSVLSASAATASPSATTINVPPQIALDCANSVPLTQNDALRVMDGLKATMQWQSTLGYLKDPPSDYIGGPPVDIMAGFDAIRSNVTSGKFQGEFEFQRSINDLIIKAHDGHFSYIMDALPVFAFARADTGPLVSVSQDGKAMPKIYRFNDLNSSVVSQNSSWTPSAILTIDDQDAVAVLTSIAQQQKLQDPDAAYNVVMYQLAQAELGSFGTFFGQIGNPTKPQTKLTFENGTTTMFNNVARVRQNFTGVDSGETFYAKFCNGLSASSSATETMTSSIVMMPTATSMPTAPARIMYPPAQAESPEGSLAGYFMNTTGMEDVAILSINAFEEQEAQNTLTKFLDACRAAGKKKLVIDVQANGGGNIFWGYDYFKQLFPTIDPFGGFNLRAFDQMNFVGQTVSNDTQTSRNSGNATLFDDVGGDSPFDVTVMETTTGGTFDNWDKFFSSEFEAKGDKFTNLARNNISDVMLTGGGGGIVVSGFGNRTQIAPQPFSPENMVILTDGYCASTCHLFTHFLKFQGKVKSVVAGGRPQNGPMQAVGGVKGAQVFQLPIVLSFVQNVFDQELTPATPQDIARFNSTDLGTVNVLGDYLVNRTAGPEFGTVNLKNSISENDPSMTPMQFVYEAADCRFWWTKEMLFDVTKVWERAANVMWNANNGSQWCVEGSMSHSSSISGDQNLGAGPPTNISSFPALAREFMGVASRSVSFSTAMVAMVVNLVALCMALL